MTPEAARFLEKARKLLGETNTMLRVELNDAAGRAAYLAGFHAAQALIFECTGRVAKSHKGVQAEFLRLTKGDANIDRELRAFLSRAYDLKSIADYETGLESEISPARAVEAFDAAVRFITHIEALISARSVS